MTREWWVDGENTHVSTLLLSITISTLVQSSCTIDSIGCEIRSVHVNGGVGRGVVIKDFGNVVFGEKRKGVAEVCHKIIFRSDGLWNEVYALICVVLRFSATLCSERKKFAYPD